MKMTIYLPEDLAEMVKQYSDLNVSAVCQEALRGELARREEMAKLDKGMERQVVYLDRLGGEVAFTGKELYYSGRAPEQWVYLTRRHRIAIYNGDAQALYEFDSFDDLASEPGWRDGEPELMVAVADALGEKHLVELDI